MHILVHINLSIGITCIAPNCAYCPTDAGSEWTKTVGIHYSLILKIFSYAKCDWDVTCTKWLTWINVTAAKLIIVIAKWNCCCCWCCSVLFIIRRLRWCCAQFYGYFVTKEYIFNDANRGYDMLSCGHLTYYVLFNFFWRIFSYSIFLTNPINLIKRKTSLMYLVLMRIACTNWVNQ